MNYYYNYRLLSWVLLTLFIFFQGVKSSSKNYDEILKSLKYPERLVFDVTKSLNEKLAAAHSKISFTESLPQIGVRLSPILFYTPGESLQPSFSPDDDSLQKSFKVVEPVMNIPVGIYIPRPRILVQSKEPPKDFLLANHSLLFPVENKLGLENVVIIHIDILLDGFILSYSAFKSKLRETLDRRIGGAHITPSNFTVYAKLNFLPNDQPNNGFILTNIELYRKYYFYFLQFVVFWLNDEENNERIILESFQNRFLLEEGFDGTPLNKLLAVKVNSNLEYGACEFEAMMEHVTSNCSSVTMERNGLLGRIQADKCILSTKPCDNSGRNICNRPSVNSSMPDINLRYYFGTDLNHFSNDLRNIQASQTGLPWKLFELYFKRVSKQDRNNLANLIKQALPPEVALACGIQEYAETEEYFTTDTYNSCNFLWDRTKVFVWSIRFQDTIQMDDLMRRLILIERKKQEFLASNLGKVIKLRIHFESQSKNVDESLTCKPEVVRVNEKAEVVMNFARINNLSLEIIYQPSLQGWRQVEVVSELKRELLRFPVYVWRNYPDKFLLGEFSTDPCLTWMDVVPSEGIALDREHAGTTLYMAGLPINGSINSKELGILLSFAFHKFSLVELVPGSSSELETVIKALSVKQLGINWSTEKPAKLYLKIDQRKNFLEKDILKKLEKVASKIAGIHFVLRNSSLGIDESSLRKIKLKNVAIGISLEDCVSEVNSHFANLRGIFITLPQLDYILCNINKPAEASNRNRPEVAKYLDTTLYIRKYFERMFPNEKTKMELMFRLNPTPYLQLAGSKSKPNSLVSVPDFLTFLADVGRYAEQNKMRFFMVPTFDDMGGSRFGWWGLSNFSSLMNTSIFTEKESEYLGRETWRLPLEISVEPEFQSKQPSLILYYAASGTGLFVVILVFVLLLLRFCRMKRFTLLTKEEVAQFRYGDQNNGRNNNEEMRLEGFDGRKFPEEFSIAKTRFLLTNIIGKGIFGVVCNATLLEKAGNKATSVLVKTPHPDCSKEEFKRMLAELKVLCYVGSHPHVLQFVGAYVEEIGRGVLYVATALCENGSLQDYLRKLNNQLTRPSMLAIQKEKAGLKETEFVEYKPDLNELTRFAHEIASGMEYISSKNIVHGDLSTRNVLLDGNQQCKIADVAGLSSKLHELLDSGKNKRGNFALPWRYLAIEVLKNLEFTGKSDVWSYGVTMWGLFSLGSVPYPGLSYSVKFVEDIENGFRMPAPAFSTDLIYDMMEQCWDANPEGRPSFTQLAQFFGSLRARARDGTPDGSKLKLTLGHEM